MFLADPDVRNASTLAAFLEGCGAGSYEELTDRANSDPEWFWTGMLNWYPLQPYERLHGDLQVFSRGLKGQVRICRFPFNYNNHASTISISYAGS